jgi:hypothetical protein
LGLGGLEIWVLWCRVHGSRFRVYDLGVTAYDGFAVSGVDCVWQDFACDFQFVIELQ